MTENRPPEPDELPQVETVAEPKKSFFEKLKTGASAPYTDPQMATTTKLLLTVVVVGLAATYFLGGSGKGDSQDALRYERGTRVPNAGPAREGSLSADEEAAIIARNEEVRQNARENEATFTPDRIALVDFRRPDRTIPAATQSADVCRDAVQRGIDEGLEPDEIIERAATATREMARARAMGNEEILSMVGECTRYAARLLGLSNDDTIAIAAKMASLTAQQLGMSEEEQVRAAAQAALETAKALGLSEEEQVRAAAKAAAETAALLGWSEERQVEAAAQAAREAAATLGWSEERQVAAAAQAARERAAELGWSEQRQVDAAAKAARDAAAALGWSEDRQVRAAAQAARDAAKTLGWSEQQQIDAAAKAAREAAASLGWSEERQIEAAAQAAREAAASLGWSEERQIQAAAKAALEAAKALGRTGEELVQAAARGAHLAAKELGKSDAEQITAASRAAMDAARDLGWDKDAQLNAASNAARLAAERLGWDKQQQVIAASGASADAAALAGLPPLDQVLAAVRTADAASAALALTENERETLMRAAAKGAASTRAATPDDQHALANKAFNIAYHGSDKNVAEDSKPKYTRSQIEAIAQAILTEQQNTGRPGPRTSLDQYKATATQTKFPITAMAEESESPDASPAPNESQTGVTTGAPNQKPAVAAGHFMHGVQITRLNTDTPTDDVVGVIIGGPFDGARIIGKWTKNGLWGETVGLTFDRMNWKGQEVADVELIAFHPESSLPGFATEVDHHYLQRFVGVAMRAIGAGGTAAIQSRRQVIQQFNDQGQLTGVQQNALHYELARELFMMEALKETGKFAERWEARPITIDVYNESMKLLVMKNLHLPTNAE